MFNDCSVANGIVCSIKGNCDLNRLISAYKSIRHYSSPCTNHYSHQTLQQSMYKPLLTQTLSALLIYLKECLCGSLLQKMRDPRVILFFRICLFSQARSSFWFISRNGDPVIFSLLSSLKQYTNDKSIPAFERPITAARPLLDEKYSNTMTQ